MRHRTSRLRLTQKPAHAALLQRNLVTSLLLYESVRTTRKRARVIQPMVDHLIAMSKRTDARNAIRAINQVVTDKNASRKIMEVFIKRYATRSSGFTTLIPAGARKGDGAELVDLTLIDAQIGGAPKEVKAKKPAKAAKKPAAKKAETDSSSAS